MIRGAIRRPVAVTMAYGAVAALGAFAWRSIPIEALPETQLPKLTVSAVWPGSSPETTEAFLTSPLEAEIQQVKGVANITSRSFDVGGNGQSAITVEFERDTDMDFARLELSERMSALEEDLPPEVGGVTVTPYVPAEIAKEDIPFLQYQLTGPYTQEALRAHLDQEVIPALGEIEGVAKAEALGGRKRRLDVRLDPEKARSVGIAPDFLQKQIADLDLAREAGIVRDGDREWTVTIANRPSSPADVLDAVIATAGAKPIRVRDVATLSDTYEEAREYRRIDGRPAVSLRVYREIGTNTVDVADRVKARIAELEKIVPYGSRYVPISDQSERIRAELSDLSLRAGAASFVIFLVLLAFLRSFGSAVLVFATIGFSVLITLNIVYLRGMSMNLLTMMGMAMGFGLLVDNCIVVLENIHRRWQLGDAPIQAAEEGAREVFAPIVASTATNLIVFLPFIYLQGEMRAYYVPLAIVVAISQIASMVVGFTFIPAAASRMLGKRARTGVAEIEIPRPAPARDPIHTRFYAATLGWTLRNPWVTVTIAAATFGGSAWLFDQYVTRGRVFGGGFSNEEHISIRIVLPRGSNLERTDQVTRFFEDKIAQIREVESWDARVDDQSSEIDIWFPDSLRTSYVPYAIKQEMEAYSHTFTGVDVRVSGYTQSFYGGGGSAPNYNVTVLGYDYEKVRDIATDLGGRLMRMSRIDQVDVNSSGTFTLDKATEYVVTLDRDALSRYGLTPLELVDRVGSSIGGYAPTSSVELGGDLVSFQVKMEGSEYSDVHALRETSIQIPGGRQVRLGDVASVTLRQVPASVDRENQQYARNVSYQFRGPAKLGDALLDAMLARTELPPGYTIRRRTYDFLSPEDQKQLYLVLGVSLVLVYMVTAATFESMIQPLCVLFAVPMGLIGTFMVFFYTNATFTREAYVGVIMAGGIVVNNAILLIDHINHVRAVPGTSFDDAIVHGTLQRVRPILMTSVTTVMGLSPLVLFSDADATIWNAMSLTLIGGLISSTFLVLTVTPALYKLFERGGAERAASGAAAAIATPLPELAPAAGG